MSLREPERHGSPTVTGVRALASAAQDAADCRTYQYVAYDTISVRTAEMQLGQLLG